ncbi:hypothetical protein ACR79T_15495 [Sphingobacterium spiritivorum]|uniref:hypothetical protein n=1 Tax=Sphingobacterium spiritivorum TaxID=258 RepID=UPI003DA6C8FB
MKSKQVKILLLGILGLSSWNLYGQSSEPNYVHPKQYLPSSPDVMAFNRISHIPVGLYTGKPNINIPVSSLKLQDYEFPISINYNASGIKVEEIASSVGLGWSLSAYDNISVGVNGFGDFQNNGFATLSSTEFKLPDNYLTNLLSYKQEEYEGGVFYRLGLGSAEGIIDTQPDTYSYSINGNSGKFYFDQFGQPHTIPFNGFKIEHSGLGNNISITDLKGVKYTFAESEFSVLESNCASGPSITGQTMLLTTITLPTGSTIQFEYVSLIYTQKIQRPLSRNRPLGTQNFGLDCININTDMTVNSKVISRILSSDGTEVNFHYGANRSDLVGTKVLDRIETKKADVVQNTNFYYSYFGSGGEAVRLKLDSVKKHQGEIYSFKYNEQVNLSGRYSFSQDHWGYYNGKNNTTLLPIESEFGFTSGANRDVDPNYIQANILTRIVYPSKGYTDFVYEPNDYYTKDTTSTVAHFDHYLNSPSSQIINFSIPPGATTNQSLLKIQVSGSSSGGGIGNEPEDPQNYIVSIQGNNGFQADYTAYQNQTLGLNLTPGTYTMRFSSAGTRTTNVTLSYDMITKEYFEGNRFAGGLRLKTQTSYANAMDPAPLVESYVYSIDGKSTGQINYKPKYTYLMEKYFLVANTDNFVAHKFYIQNSNSIDPLNTVQGGSVGYTFVSKLQSDVSKKIRIDSEFSYYGDYGGRYSYPLPPVISMDWANGLLLKETSYVDNNGIFSAIKEVRNTYSIEGEDSFWNYHFLPETKPSFDAIRGIGYVIAFASPPYINGLIKKTATFYVNEYRLISKWVRQDSVITIMLNSPNNVKTESIMSYGDFYNFKPTRIKTMNSEGKVMSKLLYYSSSVPENLKTAETSLLKNKHQLTQIVLVSDSIGVNQQLDQRIAFKNFSNNRVNINKIYAKNGGADEYQQLEISLYDPYGNPTEFKDMSNSQSVYLWGYGGQYPIAEIKNATYSEIIAVLTQATINDLNSGTNTESQMEGLIKNASDKLRSNLPGSQVTSYTYKPLVGMTSKTDAKGQTEYYQYDGLQRLQHVLDQFQQLRQSYHYHYRPQ